MKELIVSAIWSIYTPLYSAYNFLAKRTMKFIVLLCMACCFLCFVREANGCQYPQRCGYLNINYPFNIKGSNCGHSNFSLVCKHNSTFGEGNTTFLSTPTGEYQVLKLSNDSLLINVTHLKAISCSVSQTGKQNFSLPRKGPFTISGSNVFASVGCYANGSFSSVTPTSKNITVGGMCAASCLKIKNPDYCNGFGCCQTTFMENWRKVKFEAMPYAKPTSGKCVFSTILDPATFKIEESDKGKFGAGTYGLKIDWGINVTETNICSTAKRMDNLCCSNHAHCKDVIGMPDYKVCVCDDGYEGDGYQGGLQCTDIDECADPKLNDCIPPPVGLCRNLEGSFTCSCTKGEGDGRKSCTEKASILIPLLIGIFSSLVGGSLIAGAMVWAVKKRKQKLLRRKYFLQNRGLLLQEYISSDRGRRKSTIFSEAELIKATNNFSEDLKVGVGGFGYVYRGKLAEGRMVAIKKCKEVDEEQIDQFINEVIILSQIDHRNVIKLLGCCLETRIPLLVYEYVSNGTLSDHIHGKDGMECLTWNTRLQITIDTAEALAYLHSSTSVPIVHRDIKSANILLDSTCSPKLSDFGLSCLMPTDNTHLTTEVKGTFGYLDPHYFVTVQLTHKSDVYSFGVVMVELLTSMKPLSINRAKEQRNLTALFLSKKGQGLLHEIFDTRLVGMDHIESMTSVANLAEACLDVDVQRRPSMKDVVQELLWIKNGKMRGGEGYTWQSQKDINEEETSVLIDSEERSHHKKVRFDESSNVFYSFSGSNVSSTFQVESIDSVGSGR
ncbi:wall-associated receptor kinase-like 6 [Cryptomeria japonica]|uniref:wall-associated receptor kinase-like 6 n=1 Tax=Cryptomeria japonica TaxID=3369 RepID=UPI0025AC4DDB|nr:wall-associated receptor kinase-like 6 [Cryptomeria japonica]